MPARAPARGELGRPRRILSAAQLARFEAGRAAFFHLYTAGEGLGPVFNEVSCAACHNDPVAGGGAGLEHFVRLAAIGGDIDVLPRRGLPGTTAPEPKPGQIVAINRLPPLFGLGLFEEIPDAVIDRGCDPGDRDGDGTRGRRQVKGTQRRTGRFGYKAHNTPL